MVDIRGDTLYLEMIAAGLPVIGISVPPARHETVDPATWETKGTTLIRIDWSVAPDAAQISRSKKALGDHDPLKKTDFENLHSKIKDQTATDAEIKEYLSKTAGRS